jgi:hypothetical protein
MMNQDGIRTRIKLLLAFIIAAIAFTFCQPIPLRKQSTVTTPATAGRNSGKTVEEPFVVSAMCTLTGIGTSVDVPSGSSVRITWGWSASTEKQVQDYLDAQITEVIMDGKAVSNIFKSPIQPFNEKYAVFWSADVGILHSGNHVIAYTGTWKRVIDDGEHTFGPGGEYDMLSDRCELLVK